MKNGPVRLGGERKVPKSPKRGFLQEIKEAFFVFDLNGDGRISKDVLLDMVNDLEHPKRKVITDVVNMVKFIDYAFFEQFMLRFFAFPYSKDEVMGTLQKIVPEGCNEVHSKVLKKALLSTSRKEGLPLEEEDLDEILRKCEIQGKKKVNIEAFCNEISGE